jgi:hypothetical protein
MGAAAGSTCILWQACMLHIAGSGLHVACAGALLCCCCCVQPGSAPAAGVAQVALLLLQLLEPGVLVACCSSCATTMSSSWIVLHAVCRQALLLDAQDVIL